MTFEEFKALRRDVHSQGGEDGIIEWLFGRLAPRHRICVEFGAWDGRHLSNTFNLVENKNWRAVYIEADSVKFEDLKATAAKYPNITPVRSLVGTHGDDALDAILARQNIPEDFDLLSIDVDGSDYDIWEGVTRYRPSLVVIEHNAWMPPEIDFIDRGGRAYTGSSAGSLTALATAKGYGLLGCTISNCVFLRNDLFAEAGVAPQTVAQAFDRSLVSNILFNHAGEAVFSNPSIAPEFSGISYASAGKTWVRRLLGMPTFYKLGDAHREEGAVLKWLRKLMRNQGGKPS